MNLLSRLLAGASALALAVSPAAAGYNPPPAASQAVTLPNGNTATIGAAIGQVQPTVAQRPPGLTDDGSGGNTASSLWGINGLLYQPSQVTPGQTTWLPVPVGNVPPADAGNYDLTTATISSGGTGWVAGDVGKIVRVGAVGLTISAVTSGAISGVTVHDYTPAGCNAPTSASQTSTTGSGTGFVATLAWAGPTIGYGTTKVSSCYGGPAFRLQRSDTLATKDIGFLADGRPDVATADGFCWGAGAGQCGVSIIYDQIGTNNCTQATIANQPIWTQTNTVGAIRGITFPSDQDSATKVARYCTFATATFQPYNTSVFLAARARNSLRTSNFVTIGSNNETFGSGYNSGFSAATPGLNILNNKFTTLVAPSGPAVFGYNAVNRAVTAYANGKTASLTIGGLSSTAYAGGTIGSAATDNIYGPGDFDLGAVLLYGTGSGRSISAAESTNVEAALHQQFGIAPQASRIVGIEGDSLSQCFGTVDLGCWSRQIIPLVNGPFQEVNLAWYGTATSGRAPYLSGYWTPAYVATARHFDIVYWLDTNDVLLNGLTDAQVWANQQTAITQLKAMGSNVRVIVATMLPRTSFTTQMLTYQTAYNVRVRAGATTPVAQGGLGADGVADLASDPVLGSLASYSNTALSTDGTHLTTYGQSIAATYFAAALNALPQ